MIECNEDVVIGVLSFVKLRTTSAEAQISIVLWCGRKNYSNLLQVFQWFAEEIMKLKIH